MIVGVSVAVGSSVNVAVSVGSIVGEDVSETIGVVCVGVKLLCTAEDASGAQLKRIAALTKKITTKNDDLR